MDVQRLRETGEFSDITVVVCGIELKLHKFPFLARSQYFRDLPKDTDRIEFESFPGGLETFNLAANFCYNIDIGITKENVLLLRCAAEVLDMKSARNLAELTDRLLKEILIAAKIDRAVSVIVDVLQQACDLGELADECGLINNCLDALVESLLKTGIYSPPLSTFGNATSEKECLEKIEMLPFDLFLRLLSNSREKKVSSTLLAKLVQRYIEKLLKINDKVDETVKDLNIDTGDQLNGNDALIESPPETEETDTSDENVKESNEDVQVVIDATNLENKDSNECKESSYDTPSEENNENNNENQINGASNPSGTQDNEDKNHVNQTNEDDDEKSKKNERQNSEDSTTTPEQDIIIKAEIGTSVDAEFDDNEEEHDSSAAEEPNPTGKNETESKEMNDTNNDDNNSDESETDEAADSGKETENDSMNGTCENSESNTPIQDVSRLIELILQEVPEGTPFADVVSTDWAVKLLNISGSFEGKCREMLLILASKTIHKFTPEDLVQFDLDLMTEVIEVSINNNGASAEDIVLCKVVDDYLLELSTNNDLTSDIFIKLGKMTSETGRSEFDTMYEALELLLKSDKNIPEEELTEMVTLIDFDNVNEHTLKKAFESRVVPNEFVCEAAIHLCARLRDTLDTAKILIKDQEKELSDIVPPLDTTCIDKDLIMCDLETNEDKLNLGGSTTSLLSSCNSNYGYGSPPTIISPSALQIAHGYAEPKLVASYDDITDIDPLHTTDMSQKTYDYLYGVHKEPHY